MRIKVYGASKLKHQQFWQDIAREWTEIDFTARWPVNYVGVIPDSECYAKIFWEHDLEDVLRSDVILVYAEKEDDLRGALVEAGMAIAANKQVIVVGDNPNYGTWQYHKNVNRVKDMTDARLLLHCMSL